AFVETAEHFVIFQTQYLDTDDQSLETADEQVAEDYADPVRMAALCTCKLQHHFHNSGVADCKRSDTDEGARIGEVTQQRLEHLKESFYEEHCPALFHLVRPLLDHAGQRLFKEDQDQGHAEHDRHDDPCRERIPCQEEHDGDDYGCVEHKSRCAVRVKPHASHIFRPRGVDDVEHHRHHDEQHSESNGNNEYGVEFPEEGKGSHVVDGPHPQCRYNVLESEDTSEQESEDRGKDSRCCDDA